MKISDNHECRHINELERLMFCLSINTDQHIEAMSIIMLSETLWLKYRTLASWDELEFRKGLKNDLENIKIIMEAKKGRLVSKRVELESRLQKEIKNSGVMSRVL